MKVTINHNNKTLSLNKFTAIIYLLFVERSALKWIVENWEADRITINVRDKQRNIIE